MALPHQEQDQERIPRELSSIQAQPVIHDAIRKPVKTNIQRLLPQVRRPQKVRNTSRILLAIIAPDFPHGVISLVHGSVQLNPTAVHGQALLHDLHSFFYPPLRPQPRRRLVHQPPMPDEDQTVQAVNHLERHVVFDPGSPSSHQHESAGENCLKGDAANGAVTWPDRFHRQDESCDVASSAADDAVKESHDEE